MHDAFDVAAASGSQTWLASAVINAKCFLIETGAAVCMAVILQAFQNRKS